MGEKDIFSYKSLFSANICIHIGPAVHSRRRHRTHLRMMVFVGDLDGVWRAVDSDDERLSDAQAVLSAYLAVLERLQLRQTHAHVLALEELLSANASQSINPLIATLKPHSNWLSYSNTVIGTLADVAVDGWAVTFGTASRELGGAPARSGPSSLYQM